jgi:hypothetical protein
VKLSAILAPLIGAKAPHDQIMAVVEAFEAQQSDVVSEAERIVEASREKARDRVRRWRENHKSNVTERNETSRNVRKRLTGAEAHAVDKNSNLEIEPQEREERKTRGERASLPSEFETAFWSAYPNKVGKAAALKAFVAARKRVDLTTMIEGLNRYAGKTDDRPWCNPATWLNQDRWTDMPAAVVLQRPAEDWSGRLKVWNEDRTWAPGWGPKPDEPGFRGPGARASPRNPIRDVISNLRNEMDAADGRTSETGSDRPPHVRLLVGGRSSE